MTRHGLDAPDTLTAGDWRPDGKGTLRWLNDAQPGIPNRDDLHLLIACPTCRAKVDESCRAGMRRDGARARRTPHLSRLAPRLCRCGAGLTWKRKMCDACRDGENRANKRDYMRRWRGTKTPVVERDSRVLTVDSGATKRPPGGASTPLIPGASPTTKESTDA